MLVYIEQSIAESTHTAILRVAVLLNVFRTPSLIQYFHISLPRRSCVDMRDSVL